MSRIRNAAFALSLALMPALPVWAGDFREVIPNDQWEFDAGDVTEACLGRFDGVIGAGDDVGRGFGSAGAPLCLNSPGGNLATALEMNTDGGWHTRVLPGERCESACAIAFLRGGYETGNGVPVFVHDRAIWAGAKLGFHSPGLALPAGTRVDSSSVEQAFKVALRAAAGVYFVHQQKDIEDLPTMNAYLYQRFLDTPPDQMHYIDTVGEAILAQIRVLGVDTSVRVSKETVRNLCENAMISQERFVDYRHVKFITPNRSADALRAAYAAEFDDLYSGDSFLPAGARVQLMLTEDRDGDPLGYMGPVPSGDYRFYNECFVRFPRKQITGNRFAPFEAPYDDVQVWISSGYEMITTPRAVQERWEQMRNDNPVEVSSLALFPFDAKLADLPKNDAYRALFDRARPAALPKPANTAVSRDRFQTMLGRDVTGRDLTNMRLSNSNACLAQCKDRRDCDIATYDRWNKLCFLKSATAASQVVVIAKATSFVRQTAAEGLYSSPAERIFKKRNNKSFPGRAETTLAAGSYERCVDLCRGRDWCLGVNFRATRQQCEMFREPPEYFTERGVDIGFLEQIP